jgi:predicted benzoate:H+ symporter BenE
MFRLNKKPVNISEWDLPGLAMTVTNVTHGPSKWVIGYLVTQFTNK